MPIVEIAPGRVYLPTQQHIGSPAKPIVKAGDAVRVGQCVAQVDGAMSAAVHASVSGVVAGIEETESSDGKKSTTIVIESDGKGTMAQAEPRAADQDAAPGALLEALASSGIVGMGGATFPTHVKLKVKPDQIDVLIINGAECEPILSADDMLMRLEPESIVEGCAIALRITGASRAVIAIEDNKPEAIAALQKASAGHAQLSVEVMPTRYPRGGEKQLIQFLTGREVPEGGLPSAVGVVVLNAATTAAVANYLLRGRPLTHRLCTVAGDVVSPQTVRFPIGTPVQDILDRVGGPSGTPAMIIQGGPMMGKTIESLEAPMLKGANGLIVYAAGKPPVLEEQPCIRCNRCAEACPMRLLPMFLDRAYLDEDWAACARLYAKSCINCGCCTYVCPAGRGLAARISEAGNKLDAMEKEEQD